MSTPASGAPPGFNYATFDGIHSLAAAIVFTVIYVPLLVWFLLAAIRKPQYVFIILTFFCIVRLVSFALRSALAGSTKAAETLSLLVAYLIIYNVGFFGLLYSAYTLVLDRETITGVFVHFGLISKVLRNRALIRVAMIAAVALGTTGASMSAYGGSQSAVNTGNSLRATSVYIFLTVTCLLAVQTILLARAELQDGRPSGNAAAGSKHAIFLLTAITLLLLARESFYAATLHHLSKQQNEHFFYPLCAVPEFLAVCLFAIPGLVPPRAELRAAAENSDPSKEGYPPTRV